jgi:hypothetical protein
MNIVTKDPKRIQVGAYLTKELHTKFRKKLSKDSYYNSLTDFFSKKVWEYVNPDKKKPA